MTFIALPAIGANGRRAINVATLWELEVAISTDTPQNKAGATLYQVKAITVSDIVPLCEPMPKAAADALLDWIIAEIHSGVAIVELRDYVKSTETITLAAYVCELLGRAEKSHDDTSGIMETLLTDVLPRLRPLVQ